MGFGLRAVWVQGVGSFGFGAPEEDGLSRTAFACSFCVRRRAGAGDGVYCGILTFREREPLLLKTTSCRGKRWSATPIALNPKP